MRKSDVVIPPIYMQNINEAIRRDGIFLARVPAVMEADISHYGGRETTSMIQFRASAVPDCSSWKMIEVCTMAVCKCLTDHLKTPLITDVMIPRVNVFHEVLVSLVERFRKCVLEINV